MENTLLQHQIFINGEKRGTDQYYDLKNPYDLSVIARIPLSSEKEMEEAIICAHQAFEITKERPAFKRSEILAKVAELIEAKAGEFADLISLESGKPIKAARVEVSRTIQVFKIASEETKRMYGETIPMDAVKGGENKLAFTIREPIGVVAAITPFNFPLNLVAHKVAPAIAAGNTVVLKPAEQTPLTSLLLAEVIDQAGLTKGALNVVTGDGQRLGHVMNTHPLVKKISFTGSPEVGIKIREKSGLKKITLELGSNTALIIDKECNLNQAVKKAVVGGFAYSGQVCIHTQRVYVHEDIFEEFVEKFKWETSQLIIGAPYNETTDISAIINEKSLDRILSWITEAMENGALLIMGGERKGQIITPTILANVIENEKVVCSEVFGPVVVINKIKNIDEGITLTNQSRFGLNAGIFTSNIQKAIEGAKKLQVGQVMINETPTFRLDHMPYGGIKDSGLGKEGIRYAMDEMTEEKLIVISI